MEHLSLPVFKKKRRKKRWLSMDEYLRFVTDNLKYAINLSRYAIIVIKKYVDIASIFGDNGNHEIR